MDPPDLIDPQRVFARTAAGEEAMQQRTRTVRRNLRMVLILVDGQATVAELCEKTGNGQLTRSALSELESDGFIERRVDGVSTWRLPANTAGLYGDLLDHAEKAHGRAATEAFALAIALSRQGWREADLLDLVPRLILTRQAVPGRTGPGESGSGAAAAVTPTPGGIARPFDQLALASLCDEFRGNVIRRGTLRQVDFEDAQLRLAVLARYAPAEAERQPLHRALGDYLDTLPENDPLIQIERMHQLIGERDALRAARHYATLADQPSHGSVLRRATDTLVDWLRADATQADLDSRLTWLCGWFEAAGLEDDEAYRLAKNFLFALDPALATVATTRLRKPLLVATRGALERLTRLQPANALWQRSLLVARERIADLRRAQGGPAEAHQVDGTMAAIDVRSECLDPAGSDWLLDEVDVQELRHSMDSACMDFDAACHVMVDGEEIRYSIEGSEYGEPPPQVARASVQRGLEDGTVPELTPREGFSDRLRRLLGRATTPELPDFVPNRRNVRAGMLDRLRRLLRRPAPPVPDGNAARAVCCSVYAHPRVPRGRTSMVQVWAHPPARAEEVRQAAREADAGAVRRGSRTLEIDIVEGRRLTVELLTPGLEVEEPVQSLTWRARPESVQFLVTVPAEHAECDVFGTVRVAVDSVPVGHVKFVLTVVGTAASGHAGAAPEATGRAHTYRSAFISYARSDRNAVLQRVQMLEPFGIDYFQDILDLRPGDQYEGLIFQRIDACDLFLLFWSTAARESEWVMKEVRRALVRKAGNDEAPPEICPVIIEGPPAPAPPPELAHLHFDDRLLYFMRP